MLLGNIYGLLCQNSELVGMAAMLTGLGKCCFVNKPVRCRYFAAVVFFQLEMKQLERLIRIEEDKGFSAGSTWQASFLEGVFGVLDQK